MKTIYKIIVVSLLLSIGFIPTSTAASFEPAKTALYLGNDNPGNYSLLQYVLTHSSHVDNNQNTKGMDSASQIISHDDTTTVPSLGATLVLRLNVEGNNFQIPFSQFALFFETQPSSS